MKSLCLAVLLSFALAGANENAILWKDPGPVTGLNLVHGVGGADMAPQPPFLFQEEDKGGTTPKILVRDANKRVWSVKFGEEARAETFASRLAWAAGYYAEPAYFIPQANLDSVGKLSRSEAFVDRANNNLIRNGRFELRDPMMYKFAPSSSWDLENKTIGDPRYVAGLKILMMLVSNWDAKAANTAVVAVNGQPFYAITDWGASMGRTGDITGRSKWDCEGYAKQSEGFVDGIDNGFVTFNYDGKRTSVVSSNIKVEDVKWFADRMAAMTDDQIRSGLLASGATASEAACFTSAIRKRLDQLVAAGRGGSDATGGVTRIRTVTKTTTEKVQE